MFNPEVELKAAELLAKYHTRNQAMDEALRIAKSFPSWSDARMFWLTVASRILG